MEHVTTNEQRIDPRQIRYPQPPPEVASTLVTTSTTTTYTTPSSTTPSGTTPSGFFSEARTSVTSLGTVGRKTMLEMSVRSKLSRIKRVIRQRPHIFLDSQGTKQIQEVDYIYNELQDCSRCVGHYVHMWTRYHTNLFDASTPVYTLLRTQTAGRHD